MAKVVLYTTPICPFCVRAKQLLKRKGVSYVDIDIWGNRKYRAEMMERAGGKTSVPQIFIDETHVGGCDELYALERSGKLDAMLAKESA